MGSLYYFISSDFMHKMKNILTSRSYEQAIIIPSGEVLTFGQEVWGCPLDFCRYVIKMDLLVLEIVEFDIILSMVWFSTCHATINF